MIAFAFAVATTAVADPTGPMKSPIFNGMNIAIVLGILLVGYIYLWMTNTESALRLTAGVFKVVYNILLGFVKVIGNLFSAIGRKIFKERR